MAESETADPWQPKWNKNQKSLPQPCIPWTGRRVPWKAQWLGAGVWGVWSNPRARAAVDCAETDQGEVREETVVGNACGGKPGRRAGDTAESCVGGGAITIASFPPHASIGS